ncbi:MAG: accessory factor UbiK family protein [Proteobacteria bacterium]|nr:accessory factor UbiK family protein [Pseudomonadota bacterium]
MQTENRFFDDLARVANGAVGTFANIRTEIETLIKQRLERLLSNMDLVPREEFNVVKAMAAKAREEQEILAKRVTELEASLAKTTKPKAAKRPPRTASKAQKPAGKTTKK